MFVPASREVDTTEQEKQLGIILSAAVLVYK